MRKLLDENFASQPAFLKVEKEVRSYSQVRTLPTLGTNCGAKVSLANRKDDTARVAVNRTRNMGASLL